MVEMDALQGRNLLSKLIIIDTNKDDDGLLRAIDAINSLPEISLYSPTQVLLPTARAAKALQSAAGLRMLPGTCHCQCHVYHSGGPNPDVIGVYAIPMSRRRCSRIFKTRYPREFDLSWGIENGDAELTGHSAK